MPGAGDAAAVRRGAPARRGLPPRLRGAHARRAPLQHRDPRRARRRGSSRSTARCTCPATRSPSRGGPFQHLERRYFEPGPDGFRVHRAFGGLIGIAICNDRRWPETYRVLGLQGVELICIGYNTPIHYAPDPGQDRLAGLPQQPRDGRGRVPERHVGRRRRQGRHRGGRRGPGREPDHRARRARSSPGPRPAPTRSSSPSCDLDLGLDYKRTVFDFDRYRRPEMYGPIAGRPDGELPEG